jgi:hypothetical protein
LAGRTARALHPDGGPLDRVADAAGVSADLSEESDALLGHFVDQARRSGATRNEIGAAMGVTKQAAQKRFVPGRHGDFSRFTERAVPPWPRPGCWPEPLTSAPRTSDPPRSSTRQASPPG